MRSCVLPAGVQQAGAQGNPQPCSALWCCLYRSGTSRCSHPQHPNYPPAVLLARELNTGVINPQSKILQPLDNHTCMYVKSVTVGKALNCTRRRLNKIPQGNINLQHNCCLKKEHPAYYPRI